MSGQRKNGARRQGVQNGTPMVPVGRAPNEVTAHAWKGRLEAEGIPCILRPVADHSSSMRPFLYRHGVYGGSYELYVPRKRAVLARDVLGSAVERAEKMPPQSSMTWTSYWYLIPPFLFFAAPYYLVRWLVRRYWND